MHVEALGGVASGTVTVQVNPQHPLGRIPDEIFGWQHGEVADPIFRGLWAELLANRKFGGHDEPAAATRVATVIAHIRTDVFHEFVQANPHPPAFGVVNPWYAVNADANTYFHHDNTTFYVGGQSQRVEIKSDDDVWHGVAQAGLRVQHGHTYVIRLVSRTEGLSSLRVRLTNASAQDSATSGPELATVDIPLPGREWSVHETTLTPTGDAANAAFHIEAQGAGTLWLGAASLMPADHIDGFRRDVVDAVAALKPDVIRWGGNTTQYYRWRGGIGPRDLRAPFMDAWDSLITHDFGTHEFVHYCRLVGAEPLICANAGDSPEDAAEWVEYCNAPADRGLGRLRADNGALEPFNVKLWSLGNEVYGNWVVGHCDPETYGRRARAMGEAMLRVDPTVKLILVGDWEDREWNRRMLRHAAPIGDYLSLHWYPKITTTIESGANDAPNLNDPKELAAYRAILATADAFEQRLCEIQDDMRSVLPGGPLPIALDEWSLMLNVTTPRVDRDRWGRVKDMRDSLFVASAFNRLFRQPNLIGLSTYTRLHRYGLYTDQTGLFASPDVVTIGMLRDHMQPFAVGLELRNPAQFDGLPALDATASANEDGHTFSVCLVNRHPQAAIPVLLQVTSAPTSTAEVHRVAGRSYVDANQRAEPTAVSIDSFSVDPAEPIHLPPASVSVVTFHVK